MSSTLECLGKLDACAVSDAMDALQLPAAVTGIRRQSTDRTIVGQVITVRLGDIRPAGALVRHLCTKAIERCGSKNVIIIEQRTGLDAGGWGGILSNAAKEKGCRGVIVDGPSRDIDEARQLEFPVFARSTTARTARGRVFEQETGGPVMVGPVRVEDADYVIADDSGIVFIPAARIEEVLAVAERIAAKEKLMVAAIRAGEPVTQVMGADYERMLDETHSVRGPND